MMVWRLRTLQGASDAPEAALISRTGYAGESVEAVLIIGGAVIPVRVNYDDAATAEANR